MLRNDQPAAQKDIPANVSVVSLAKSFSASEPSEVASRDSIISGHMELSRVHHSVHSSESPADESSNIAKLEQHAVESTVMDLTPIDSLTEASKIKIYHAESIS